MPLQHTYPEIGPMAKQHVTPSGAVSVEFYPPNLLSVTYHKTPANRATIDDFFAVMEAWGQEVPKLLMFQDLRAGDDMSLENRIYMARRYKHTVLNGRQLAIAFVTHKTYQRVILSGVMAFAPPPAPYITTTSEAEAVRFLLAHAGRG